jgi:hypothetical protein
MIVSSASLLRGAQAIRESGRGTAPLGNGVVVSAAQLEKAAEILQEADPAVITSPRRMASSQERPGFIEPESQETDEALVFQMGILPSIIFRIDRDGGVT